MGTLHTKTLLDVYLLSANLAVYILPEEETAMGASTGDDVGVAALRRGDSLYHP